MYEKWNAERLLPLISFHFLRKGRDLYVLIQSTSHFVHHSFKVCPKFKLLNTVYLLRNIYLYFRL